nr:MAG TPA: hypothetical protein [Caudoviricetes sp.]
MEEKDRSHMSVSRHELAGRHKKVYPKQRMIP